MINEDTQFVYGAGNCALLYKLPNGQACGFPLAQLARIMGPDGRPFWKNVDSLMIGLPHVGTPPAGPAGPRIVIPGVGSNDFAALRAGARKKR